MVIGVEVALVSLSLLLAFSWGFEVDFRDHRVDAERG